MHSFMINIRTGEKISCEEFVLMAWSKAEQTYKDYYNLNFEDISDESKADALAGQFRRLINFCGWRLAQDN